MAFVLYDLIDFTFMVEDRYYKNDKEELWQTDRAKARLFPTPEAAQAELDDLAPTSAEQWMRERIFVEWTDRPFPPTFTVNMTSKEKAEAICAAADLEEAERVRWLMKRPKEKRRWATTGRLSSSSPNLQNIPLRHGYVQHYAQQDASAVRSLYGQIHKLMLDKKIVMSVHVHDEVIIETDSADAISVLLTAFTHEIKQPPEKVPEVMHAVILKTRGKTKPPLVQGDENERFRKQFKREWEQQPGPVCDGALPRTGLPNDPRSGSRAGRPSGSGCAAREERPLNRSVERLPIWLRRDQLGRKED